MFNLKNFKYCFSIAVLLSVLLGSQTLPTKAQQNSPSLVPLSGTAPAINTTVFSVPPTINITTTGTGVTITTEGTQFQITAPPSVVTAVNNSLQNIINQAVTNNVGDTASITLQEALQTIQTTFTQSISTLGDGTFEQSFDVSFSVTDENVPPLLNAEGNITNTVTITSIDQLIAVIAPAITDSIGFRGTAIGEAVVIFDATTITIE